MRYINDVLNRGALPVLDPSLRASVREPPLESLVTYGHVPYIPGRETTMATQDTRDARLEARVSVTQKSLLQQAAALSGRTLSEFVVASAQDAARRVIAEHESILLSREEQLAFVQALLNPPEPNARLKRAAKAYRQRTGT